MLKMPMRSLQNLALERNAFFSLPSLIDRASTALQNARSSAEVLEARDLASVAYDAAKKAARLHKAKGAHDELIAAAHRAQADALEIEAGAKRRLADEYDAAQERGEIKSVGKPNSSNPEELAGVNDIGLTHKDIHEARLIRDAEVADPGIVRRTLLKARPSQQFPGHVFGARRVRKFRTMRVVTLTTIPRSSAERRREPRECDSGSLGQIGRNSPRPIIADRSEISGHRRGLGGRIFEPVIFLGGARYWGKRRPQPLGVER